MSVDSRAHLARTSKEYSEHVATAKDVFTSAAKAEAWYRKLRAMTSIRFKESGERMSQAEANDRADADDAVYEAHLDRLVKAAKADALKEELKEMRERSANNRTYITDEREGDLQHSRTAP